MNALERHTAGALLVVLLAVPGWFEVARADDAVTMEVVDDADADERDYVDDIELPETASETARDKAAFGLDTANEARKRAEEDGRSFGQATAREAREAREQGRDAGNAARAAGGRRDGGPEGRPVEVQ